MINCAMPVADFAYALGNSPLAVKIVIGEFLVQVIVVFKGIRRGLEQR